MPTSESAKPKSAVATKFPAVAEFLRTRIGRGEWTAGERLPTFSQLQTQYQVTPGTVSRALLTLQQEGLIVREQGRGIFVAPFAPTASKAAVHAVGLRGYDAAGGASEYWSALLGGVQQVAHAHELEVTLLKADSTRCLSRVDGVVLHGSDTLREDIPPIVPAVGIMEVVPGQPSIVADDCGGMRAATEHLLSLGHRAIAVIAFLRSPIIKQRMAGYRAALQAAGIEERVGWAQDLEQYYDGRMWDRGRAIAAQWVADKSAMGWRALGCTAVLCQNDQLAAGLLNGFYEAGIRVPGEVSVVGFDGTAESERTTPPLTTVRVPLDEIGAAAMELLVRQIKGDSVHRGVLTLPSELVVRSSTGPPSPMATS